MNNYNTFYKILDDLFQQYFRIRILCNNITRKSFYEGKIQKTLTIYDYSKTKMYKGMSYIDNISNTFKSGGNFFQIVFWKFDI